MTSQVVSLQHKRIPLRQIMIASMLGWTVVAICVYVLEVVDNHNFVTANAIAIGRASYQKDIAFRTWASSHGGVYVPVTVGTPPNPYLNAPEREIRTPSGKLLTLMNPAYMIRQIYESVSLVTDSPQGHITSLNPLRPENLPDIWERKALEAFAKGVTEFSEYQDIEGKRYFRFMHVMKTEKSCLKCHAVQGYQEGDVRGGISVTIPVTGLERMMSSSNGSHLMIVSIVWGLGIAGICLSGRIIGRAAGALAESEEYSRQLFQQSLAVMLIIDPENGAIVDANPAACSFYGYSWNQLQALNISDVNTCPADELARCIAEVQDGGKGSFKARHRHSGGTSIDVEVLSSPVIFKGKTLLHSIIIDISGRLAAEAELLGKMDFAENLIMNSTSPTFVINSDHQVMIWNRAMEELTGVRAQEIIGTSEQWRAFYQSARSCLADIILTDSFEKTPELYTHCSRSHLIPDGLHAEGDFIVNSRKCHLVFSAAPIRDRDGKVIAAIETLEDITARMSLEAQLFQAQKMESVGELAGGIAHDFNNLLTVISGYSELMQITLQDNEENISFAKEISASVERGADMTRSLLAFSGKHEMMPQVDDINYILASISKSMRRLIREDITLTIHPAEGPLPVYVERVQIEQLLINLVVNARDALVAGGTITVSSLMVECENMRTEGSAIIPPGHYACLSVADGGSGMNAETLKQIFEPFFTTKDRGKGTGLGLAIVHSIVAKHNGCISVNSSLGRGTEFRVYFPLYAGENPKSMAKSLNPVNHHGTETVLMVEDDEDIMKLYIDVLGRYGYKILSASDGFEAMKVFNSHKDEISIAVVDVIMPRMNGLEVAEQVKLQCPEMPIIMTSGYPDDIIDLAAINRLGVLFLQKPVRPLDLMTAIRSCLLHIAT